MCIIAIKKPGYDMPTDEILENMWYANPDGAGLMYTNGSDKVTIKKGFMTFDDFMAAVKKMKGKINVKNESVIMHFRIGTSGGNIAANTHPFPITNAVSDLQKLSTKTSMGIVHNGIISIKPSQPNISDTMEYIKSKLYPIWNAKRTFFKYDDIMNLIYKDITSKMAFLLPNRMVYTVGSFIEDESGIIYSNSSYKRVPLFKCVNSGWDTYGGSIVPYSYGYSDYGYYGSNNSHAITTVVDDEYDDWLVYNEKLSLLDSDTVIVDRYTKDTYLIEELCGDNYFMGIDMYGCLYLIDPYSDGDARAWTMTTGLVPYTGKGERIYYDPKSSFDIVVDSSVCMIDPEVLIGGHLEDE